MTLKHIAPMLTSIPHSAAWEAYSFSWVRSRTLGVCISKYWQPKDSSTRYDRLVLCLLVDWWRSSRTMTWYLTNNHACLSSEHIKERNSILRAFVTEPKPEIQTEPKPKNLNPYPICKNTRMETVFLVINIIRTQSELVSGKKKTQTRLLSEPEPNIFKPRIGCTRRLYPNPKYY